MFKKLKCVRCSNGIKDSFDYCPHCGLDLRNPEKDMRDFGMLGKNELAGTPLMGGGSMGFTDKLVNSVFNSLMKNLEKQMRDLDSQDVQATPNGIKIQFGVPQQRPVKKKNVKVITQEQIKRMTGLPRVEAKTNVRRLSNKVVYEMKAPGIGSVEDVFVSKLATGYEIKAIGNKKVYVNSLPVELPLKSYAVNEKGLVIEFGLE